MQVVSIPIPIPIQETYPVLQEAIKPSPVLSLFGVVLEEEKWMRYSLDREKV